MARRGIPMDVQQYDPKFNNFCDAEWMRNQHYFYIIIPDSVKQNYLFYTGVLFAQPPTSTSGISKGSVTRTASMGGASSTSVAPPSAPPAPSSNSSSP
ncbi:hypothetical protein AB205_0075270 [Aquarana catesbeiana]|uniref:Uncharacterized protein n=1 Tax=Aquarana catesbeiana TaxID=8400 RepID=A0A2G9QC33_AQUCT|nr:hypothetical protein AB205_0075270 [Aquarana catesbeiana]